MSTPTVQDIQIEIGFNTMKSRRVRCMKFSIVLLNIIGILFGLILITICVINLKDKTEPESPMSRALISLLLALSIALLVTDVVGCIGALRENVKLLYVHAAFFMFLVVLQMVVSVGEVMLSTWIGPGNELRVQFYRNTTIEDDSARFGFWDKLQFENQCCGVDGPQDYSIIHRDIPASCCARAHPLREGGARRHLHSSCLSDRTYYMRGCEEALRIKKTFKGNIFISTGIIFTLVEIICIVLALAMARMVWSDRRRLQANLQAHFES